MGQVYGRTLVSNLSRPNIGQLLVFYLDPFRLPKKNQQVVKYKLRELGPWRPGEHTAQKLGWLARFVVSEVVATRNNNFEVKEWASK
jgi:hypothetical protein